jgi:hypothetical protein
MAYKIKTSQIPAKNPTITPTKNKDVTFDTPNGLFSKLSGYHVVSEYSRLDQPEMVLEPVEILTNLVLDPLQTP